MVLFRHTLTTAYPVKNNVNKFVLKYWQKGKFWKGQNMRWHEQLDPYDFNMTVLTLMIFTILTS